MPKILAENQNDVGDLRSNEVTRNVKPIIDELIRKVDIL
jgi:hypothetical protein